MQSSMRAVSWIVARTGKKGIESAALQCLPGRFRGCRSVGVQPLQRRWLCGYGSQLWCKSRLEVDHTVCSAIGRVTGGEIVECLEVQGLRDEVRKLKAANVGREVHPPEPFFLREKPGCMDVNLHRENGQENINVACELLLQPQDGVDEDNVDNDSVMLKPPCALLINLTITIIKDGSEALEISCQCHGDEYFINYISYHEDFSKKGHDRAVHEKRLSEDLKREFLFFLLLRGFDDEMAVFLHHYFEKKRNEERITSIEKVAAVLAAHAY